MKIFLTSAVSMSIANAGVYTGLGIGQTQINSNVHFTHNALNEKIFKLGNKETSPQIFVGYEGVFNKKFYWALEGLASYDNIHNHFKRTINAPRVTYHTDFHIKNSIKGTAALGISLEDFIIYGKGGISSSNIHIKYECSGQTAQTINKNTTGKIWGGGVIYKISPEYMIGIEYTTIKYGQLNLTSPNGWWHIKPKIDNFHIRFSYHF